MDNEYLKNEMLWFENLIAPKHLEVKNDIVICQIGFNRKISANNTIKVIGELIEVEALSKVEAIAEARLQYEFLTADVGNAI
jgi:hypothetical protein